MNDSDVTLTIHHRYGSAMRVSSVRVHRSEVEGLIDGIGRMRSTDGLFALKDSRGIVAAVAAQCIELIEVNP